MILFSVKQTNKKDSETVRERLIDNSTYIHQEKKLAEVKLRDNVQLGKYLPHMSGKEQITNIKPEISNSSPR